MVPPEYVLLYSDGLLTMPSPIEPVTKFPYLQGYHYYGSHPPGPLTTMQWLWAGPRPKGGSIYTPEGGGGCPLSCSLPGGPLPATCQSDYPPMWPTPPATFHA